MIGTFQRAVTQAGCFAGSRGDAGDAVNKIVELIGG
jgi:hypothetical protein